MKNKQKILAQQFQAMHHAKELLVLPNAWDAASAFIFAKAGFKAIGTSSAGIAYSLAYPDGEYISFTDILESSQRMLNRISVALTVDIETGYSQKIEEIKENVKQIIKLGAVGINIEDGLTKPVASLKDMAEQSEIIKAISEVKQELDIPFVINARIDSYWLNLGDDKAKFKETLARADSYKNAGADCIFIPAKLNKQTIKLLAQEISLAINIIASPKCLSIKELEDLGVARLSLGSGPARASLGLNQTIANELINSNFNSIYKHALSYTDSNSLFS